MDRLAYDVAHLLAGGLVLVSFLMIYQDRLYSLPYCDSGAISKSNVS